MTRIEKVSGNTVAIWATVLCCLTGILCAWLPCVMDDCKDTEHHCANCSYLLATVSNGGSVTVHTAPVPIRSQYAPQPPKTETKELDAKDTRVLGPEAAGTPINELPPSQTPAVRDVGGPPQEIGVSEKVGTATTEAQGRA